MEVEENVALNVTDRNGDRVSLENHWNDTAAFLVCGGPSYRSNAYERLADRGVLSLGVNNVAGDVPCSAFVCSDPPRKFHHGIWLDGKILKFIPETKRRGYRAKLRAKVDGEFRTLTARTTDCPSVYYFQRDLAFEPSTFFTSGGAFWGVNDSGVNATHRPKILFTFFLGLRLLHYLGVRRIYLLGVDFWMAPDSGYGFAQRRDAGAIASNNKTYRVATEMIRELKPHMERAGLECFNCNQVSRLDVFGWVPFERALQDCRNGVPAEPFDLKDWYQTDEWLEGRKAYSEGVPIESCPYGADKGIEWRNGWQAGKAEDES